MNELIKVTYATDSDRPTILGRDLHETLEIKTPYTQWFERMKEYGFTENTDFVLVSQKCETNNPKNPHTTITDHQITIEMAKEICMIQRSEKGKQCRQYFIELEKQWNSPEAVMARALKMADRKIEALKTENISLRKEIEYKEDVIVGLVDEISLADKRQILNRVVKYKHANYRERWSMLYREFENKYHMDLSRRFETYNETHKPKCKSKVEYIDKVLNKIPELYELAAKLFENDVKELVEEMYGIAS